MRDEGDASRAQTVPQTHYEMQSAISELSGRLKSETGKSRIKSKSGSEIKSKNGSGSEGYASLTVRLPVA